LCFFGGRNSRSVRFLFFLRNAKKSEFVPENKQSTHAAAPAVNKAPGAAGAAGQSTGAAGQNAGATGQSTGAADNALVPTANRAPVLLVTPDEEPVATAAFYARDISYDTPDEELQGMRSLMLRLKCGGTISLPIRFWIRSPNDGAGTLLIMFHRFDDAGIAQATYAKKLWVRYHKGETTPQFSHNLSQLMRLSSVRAQDRRRMLQERSLATGSEWNCGYDATEIDKLERECRFPG